VKQTFQDKNKEDTKIGQTEYKCANGSVFLSLKNMLSQEALNSINTMQGLTVDIDSDDMEIPTNSKEGDQLNDVVIKITALSNGIPLMALNANVTNIICQGHEKITTPAGIFDCLLITNDTNINSGYMKTSAKSKQWLTKGVGLVKIENYDDVGSLVSIMELNETQ